MWFWISFTSCSSACKFLSTINEVYNENVAITVSLYFSKIYSSVINAQKIPLICWK